MHRIICCFIFFTTTLSLYSQINWESTNGPYGGIVKSICKDSDNNLYIKTQSSAYYSTNMGLNWERMDLQDLEASAFYFSGKRCFIITEPQSNIQSKLYYSDDLKNWELSSMTESKANVNSLLIRKSNEIHAVCDSGVLLSKDRGLSWEEKFRTPDSSNCSNKILFASDTTLYLATKKGIFYTSDAGKSWIQQFDATGKALPKTETILIDKNSNLFAQTASGVYKYDAGIWQKQANGCPSSDIAFIAETQDFGLFVGSSWQGLYNSNDGGISWKKVSQINGQDIIETENKGLLYICYDGIRYTENPEGKWSFRNNGINEALMNKVYSLTDPKDNTEYLLAFDNNGNCFKSDNSAQSWEYFPSDIGYLPAGLTKDSKGVLYLATYSNGIFCSSDNGENWVAKSGGLTDLNCRAIVCDKSDIMYLGTFKGIYKSSNKGESWTQIYKQSQDIQVKSLFINTKGYIFAGTWTYGLLLSTNGGTNWKQVMNPNKTKVNFITLSNRDELYELDSENDLFYSTNNGSTWELKFSMLSLNDLFCHDSLLLGASNYGYNTAGVFRSDDKGTTWKKDIKGMDSISVHSICCSKNGVIYAATDHGIFKSSNQVVGVKEFSFNKVKFELYPNPVKSILTIRFLKRFDNDVNISIVNSAGQTVLSNKSQNGIDELNIDVSKLSAGMYNCIINKEKSSESMKFWIGG